MTIEGKEEEGQREKKAHSTWWDHFKKQYEPQLFYLMWNWIKLSKELSHCNSLRVQSPENDLLFVSVSVVIHEGHCISQNVQNFCLPSKRFSHQHKAVVEKVKPNVNVYFNRKQFFFFIFCWHSSKTTYPCLTIIISYVWIILFKKNSVGCTLWVLQHWPAASKNACPGSKHYGMVKHTSNCKNGIHLLRLMNRSNTKHAVQYISPYSRLEGGRFLGTDHWWFH